MPQWCDKHKQHTIDEVCPGCERSVVEADADLWGLELEQLAEFWIADAERMRKNIGQRTREKRGHEILEACAFALRDKVRELRARRAKEG